MFPHALRREIILLLAAKALFLVALYILFFSPAHRTEPAPGQLKSHIFLDRAS